MASDPEHVGSGSFRVDRARMLKTLKRFQLSDAAEHVLAFARAAVASGATRVDAAPLGSDGYELLFDGVPITEGELRDPYGFLEEHGTPRARFLGAGLLGAFQLGAAGVNVAAAGGVELVAGPDLDQRVGPAHEPCETNRVRVWGLTNTRDAVLALLSTRCARSRVPFSIDGRSLGPPDHARGPEPSAAFDLRGMRARVWMRFADDGMSQAALSVYGVETPHANLDLFPTAVCAEVDDDQLTLDASQSKVVHDARFQELKLRLRDAAQKLLGESLEGHRRRLRLAGKALLKDPSLLKEWRTGLGAPADHPAASGRLSRAVRALLGARTPAAWTPERSSVAEEAARTRWLRQTAVAGLKGWHQRPSKPSEGLSPLWTAPVFLDWHAKSLSFMELRTALERDGVLHLSTQSWTGRKLNPVIWQTCEADRKALQTVFPQARLSDV